MRIRRPPTPHPSSSPHAQRRRRALVVHAEILADGAERLLAYVGVLNPREGVLVASDVAFGVAEALQCANQLRLEAAAAGQGLGFRVEGLEFRV